MGKIKAQSVSEYSICILVVILALFAMQVYVRRGLQGRYRDIVLQTTEGIAGAGKIQHEPYYEDKVASATQDRNITNSFLGAGSLRRDISQDQATQDETSIEGINSYAD